MLAWLSTERILWDLAVAALLLLLDRALLRLEARGWINYRRRGLSRGAAGYHALVMQSVFDPEARSLIAATYQKEVQQNDSGEPPEGAPGDSPVPGPEAPRTGGNESHD